MKLTHTYEEMTADKRPQDEGHDLKGWTFRSSEHGGEYPDSMPQVIVATDAEGRTCKYVPITEGGRVVDSKGFMLEGSVVQPNND
jgi:hypothetical protein